VKTEMHLPILRVYAVLSLLDWPRLCTVPT
jgi:hypothetical protein